MESIIINCDIGWQIQTTNVMSSKVLLCVIVVGMFVGTTLGERWCFSRTRCFRPPYLILFVNIFCRNFLLYALASAVFHFAAQLAHMISAEEVCTGSGWKMLDPKECTSNVVEGSGPTGEIGSTTFDR